MTSDEAAASLSFATNLMIPQGETPEFKEGEEDKQGSGIPETSESAPQGEKIPEPQKEAVQEKEDSKALIQEEVKKQVDEQMKVLKEELSSALNDEED